jgi:lipopolysaccharide transport system permease protein
MTPTKEPQQEEQWDLEIRPHGGLFDLHLGEVWRYRDLLTLFVRRDLVAVYKQTILGPIWFFVQPLLTTAIYFIIFTQVAKISSDEIPPVLFYLSGIVSWNYFAECLTKTSNTFVENAAVFGKVYFPRLISPLSVVISNLIKFGIQFSLFLIILLVYVIHDYQFVFNATILLLPFTIVLMALLGLGLGMIISSLTTKYRDLTYLITFGVQLLMYATPVIYPTSILEEPYKSWVMSNPMSPLIETFRTAFLGGGQVEWYYLFQSTGVTILIVIVGVIIFQRVEKGFVDTV